MNTHSRNFRLIRELMQTKVVMMEGQALAAYRTQLLKNFNGHVSAESLFDDVLPTERHYALVYNKDTYEVTRLQFFNEHNQLVEERPVLSSSGCESEAIPATPPAEDEERVLMLEMLGPVTRCGGMCSYGSMDFRDLMLEYADDERTVGLVLITDTPGGTAFALHDFAQGMEAWRAAGKRSIQWIDGMSCSAGVACGSQCDKVIAYNAKDIIGCIGAMMAGWMTADGTVDSDGNRFIDVTATQTPDKNLEFRAAANGDYEGLQQEVDKCCEDFLSIVRQYRPNTPADQMTGKTYDAQDVIGTLIDGLGSLDDAIHYCLTGEEKWKTTQQTPQQTPQHPKGGESAEGDTDEGCGDPDKKDGCDPDKKDVCPNPDHEPDCDPDDPDHDPDDPDGKCDPDKKNSGSADHMVLGGYPSEQSPESQTQTPEDMTQLQAERLAAHMGLTAEQVMTIANTEPAAQQAEGKQQPADPAAEPAEGEQPAEPIAEPEGEQPETEEPEEPQAPAAEPAAEPAQPSENGEPAVEPEATSPLMEQMQQMMQAMQQQMQQQMQQMQQQLEASNAALLQAQQQVKDLSAQAPAPAMPAAPVIPEHTAADNEESFRPGMSAKEIIELQKRKDARRKK